MKLTNEQQLAIDIKDSNVLVSAAAGSGKTSVLVKRVIQRVALSDDPVDIDRLLIMTFTNAAAAEMAGRIRDAIEEVASEIRSRKDHSKDDLARIEKQAILVNNANITTIHGFCKRVISDHFDALSLDPDFRVADENECRLIRHEAIEECLENSYEKAEPSFLKAVRCFASPKSDAGLEKLIGDIYDFVIADPDPEGFAKECIRSYECGSFEEFCRSGIVAAFGDYALKELDRMKNCIRAATDVVESCEEFLPYRACLDGYMDVISGIEQKTAGRRGNVYDIIRCGLKSAAPPPFGRLARNRMDDDIKAGQMTVTILRDIVKSRISKLLDMMPFDLETTYEHTRDSKEELEALIDLVLDFAAIYSEKKREKNIIDFNDMEHMAVKVLSDPSIARIYRDRFEEIYVDEYQDTNMTQETLVSLICRHDPGNVFQVGDVKQSIYRFRQARPDIFLDKYNKYADSYPENRRILLNDNFRSRKEVIYAVNEVFSNIMKEDLGHIEYNEEAQLAYSAAYYDECTSEEVERDDHNTELILGDPSDLSSEEFEANVIASRINEMIADGFMVYDKGSKTMRPASYGDFTILVRSIKNYEPVFREVFEGANIPLSVAGSEGYYQTVEIKTALAFLYAVDNPLDDIPLSALARSPIGGFTDTELAGITAECDGDLPLYERLKQAAPESEKCAAFLELLRKYKDMSTYTPVHILLADFIDNEYADHVRSMTKGRQRMANLEMLLVKAEDYGRTSFKGLHQFARYIEQIRKYKIDEGEAVTESENDDVVRLMTMHASKGLEFPVCFIAGMERKRNFRDETGKVIWSTRFGIGTDHTDTERNVTVTTLPKVMAVLDNRLEGLAEEIRVLYVAMTRAREKLIMVGCDKEDGFEHCSTYLEGMSSFLDMLKAAYGNRGFSHINIKYTDEKAVTRQRLETDIRNRAFADEFLDIVSNEAKKRPDQPTDTEVPDGLSFRYPYRIDTQKKAKLSVSELKHRAIEERLAAGEHLTLDDTPLFNETNPEKYIPKFARNKGETAAGGTFYGTAFHRILELWDYRAAYENGENNSNNACYVTPDMVMGFAERMHRLHHMDKEMVDAIRPGDVADFLNSGLGMRMRAASFSGTLFREQPFVIGIDEDDDMILVQGIIDAYFTEDGKITVVDYKTDRVDDPAMLVNRYKTQLEYYKMALERITHLPVASMTIYSTCLKQEVNIG